MFMGLIRNNLLKIINPQLRLLVVLLLVVSALSFQVQLVRADDYIVEFQDGLNGYGGTLDTFIWASEPDVDHSNSITIVQEEFPGDELRSLLRFELSSIPADATITSAELQFYVSEEGEGFDMHRMLVSWNETDTYHSIGDRQFYPDNVDAEGTVAASWPGAIGYTGIITIPVITSTIQGWIDGTLSNNGWLMIASDPGDGQEIYSSEYTTTTDRPKLTVGYSLNESPTDITLSSSTVAENSAINTVVGTLSSSDPDTGDIFIYTLVDGTGGTDNDSFNIISGNSLVTLAVFDFETKPSYSIRIRTTDQGGLYYEEAFTITVSDENESPTDITLSSSTVAENSAINTVVGILSSSDPDADNTFSYRLVDGSGGADNGSFNIITGTSLITLAVFDFETKPSYLVRIRTTDQGGLFFEKEFTLTVSDVNDAPIITGQVTLSTPKNASLEISLADLTVMDQDDTYPTGFTLTVLAGINYTLIGNTITPSTDFIGTLTIPVKVNDGLVDSNTFNLSVNVTNLRALTITNIYGQTVTLQAFFDPAIINKTINFTLNSAVACSGTTNSNGRAICNTTLLADVGTYPTGVGAVFLGDADYPPSSATAQLIVLPRDLTVTANSGQYKLFGSPDPVFTYTFSPNNLPIEFSGLLSRVSGEAIGDYNITVGSLSAGPNYEISFNSDKFSIIGYKIFLPLVLK
ncbi:MAG: hypothetical protein CVU46_07375 [Chloroflexi bacterium HGW-Chloroflexi-8]|nr:MAG: hypothetical protein CVU46_07375 [Chloroflexi bacterium HGW-Chloroflexi-8]